ncbi:DUF4446 family protein [Candidatus Woesebacteria bacterium]|nr:DUF4446 family protein [Candidatus Woesebacteria bacterium]
MIIFGVWLVILSSSFYWLVAHYRKLSKLGGGNLIQILDKILSVEERNKLTLEKVQQEINKVREESEFNIQKIGLVRFNPFSETGGDHSFSLALLDGRDNGFVITSLHTRERTRVYIKEIKKTKGLNELSNEEKKAISEALK